MPACFLVHKLFTYVPYNKGGPGKARAGQSKIAGGRDKMKRVNNLYREQLPVSNDMPSGRVYFSSAMTDNQIVIAGCEPQQAQKPKQASAQKPIIMAGQISLL